MDLVKGCSNLLEILKQGVQINNKVSKRHPDTSLADYAVDSDSRSFSPNLCAAEQYFLLKKLHKLVYNQMKGFNKP